ncbi:hypothetical protein IW261DRAFT_1566573 [Armillaria novae-zelandiae]|uniref:F-box domain-containing protein n=1 Tax=Armillaria novae-zelandiae TaxID=153914 RepID=A0AA39U450_9AGAR|nr:hypothetical protein IW261DRAFT_1566573 [Armillaria novae-zelandiae]
MRHALVDTSFNDALEDTIIADIDTYTDSLEVSQLLDTINSGEHWYYQYMDALASICIPRHSVLYSSLFQYHHLIGGATINTDMSVPQGSDHPHPLICPSPTYLPPNLWARIFSLLDRCQLHNFRLVSAYWHKVASRLLFTSVHLALLTAWQLSPDVAIYRCIAHQTQIALLSFVIRNELTDVVRSVAFTNWYFALYCFFLHTFKNIHVVRFLSVPGTPATTLHIPYLYLLPSSIKHLIIWTCLESMELYSLEYGGVYIPPSPSALEMSTWRALTGLDGFRNTSVISTPFPGLRCVCLDLSYNTICHVFSPNDPLTTLDDISPLLLPGEHYPLSTQCELLMSLDVTVIHNLFPLMATSLYDVQFSLQTLVLCYPARVFRGRTPNTHINLSGLMVLKNLMVYTSLRYWHYSIQSTFSWHSLAKTLESSILHLFIKYEGNNCALHYNLKRDHFEHLLLDTISYPGQVAPLRGELYLRLLPCQQTEFVMQEYEAISTLLDSVAFNRGIQATMYLVEIEYCSEYAMDTDTVE